MFKILVLGINLFMLCSWAYVAWFLISHGITFVGVVFLIGALYLILPIRHPCDYGSYSAWWKDHKNWLK
jgi:hypothetical protein